MKNLFLLIILFLNTCCSAFGQGTIEGIVYEKGTNKRLSNIKLWNKHNGSRAITNDVGIFKIRAGAGDTVVFFNDNYQTREVIAGNSETVIVFLQKKVTLKEVTITESSLNFDLLETQRIYRSKGVFYTGTPHYYYLFVKPMTFIYENFKSEVIDARKFKKVARSDLAGQEISRKFNEQIVKNIVPLSDAEATAFVIKYWPTVFQVRLWSDYDMALYIERCYEDYKLRK